MKQILTISILSFSMQACTAVPTASPTIGEKSQFSDRFSIEGIKQRREAEYAKKLQDLNNMNPVDEVKKALKNNSIYLLVYQSGKGGSTRIPGLIQSQVNTINCRTHQLDGMGDSIYGTNHLKYRMAIQKYASEFNALMYPHCG